MKNLKNTISGKYRVEILDTNDDIISDTGWKKNLIVKDALDERSFVNLTSQQITIILSETDNTIDPVVTPNKRVFDGVVSQSGTTLTAPSEFLNSAPHKKPVEGDIIVFADGTRSTVFSRVSDVELTMYDSLDIPEQSATHYRVGLTQSVAINSGGSNLNVENRIHGSTNTFIQRQQLINDDAYNEVVYSGTSSQMLEQATLNVIYVSRQSRIVLDTPIPLVNGNRVRFSWKRRVDFGTSNFYENDNKIAGFPFKTVVDTINSDGTDITVKTQTDHYWIVGDEVNISDAIPDGSSSAPTTYFNGNWVVSDVPDPTTVKLTTTLPNSTIQSSVGFISAKNANHSVHFWGDFHDRYFTNMQHIFTSDIDELPIKPAFTDTTDPTLSTEVNTFVQIPDVDIRQLSFISASSRNNYTTVARSVTIPNETLQRTRIRQILLESRGTFGQPKVFCLITFDHVQTKLNTFDLQLEISMQNIPDLS